MTPEERFRAKRANESTRAVAAFFNNLAVGAVVAGFLSPWVSGHPEPIWATMSLILVAALLHLASHLVLRRFLEREE